MNKKILLGVGSLAAAALPVSVVVACNDKDDANNTSATTKTASVTPAAIANVAASVAGSENARTLAVVKTDTVTKADLETAFKGMVAKADGDTETPTFAGTWDIDFDGTKNATYTYTFKATGYTDVTFAVTVSGNAAVNGAITLNANAKLKTVAVTGSGPFAVTLPNGTTVTTDDVKALFTGKGMLAVADTDTYDAATPKAYTFTITDPGTNSGTVATATLEVTVSAMQKIDLTSEIGKLMNFTSADTSQKTGNVFAKSDAVGENVKAKFIKITEVADTMKASSPTFGASKPLTSALGDGVEIDTVVVKTVLDKTTTGGKLVVTVNLKKGTDTVENNSKDITITFA